MCDMSVHCTPNEVPASIFKVVLTANAGIRGGRVIHLKATVDRALRGCDSVRRVLVYEHPSHKDYKVRRAVGWLGNFLTQANRLIWSKVVTSGCKKPWPAKSRIVLLSTWTARIPCSCCTHR